MTILETSTLSGTLYNGACCMAALAENPTAPSRLSLFFSAGADLKTILPGPGAVETSRRSIGGAPVLRWETPAEGPVQLKTGGVSERLNVQQPEPDLFAGYNVGLAIRGIETAAVARDWLLYHQKHHGMDAALIVDRGKDNSFAPELAELVRDLEFARIRLIKPDFPLGRTDFPAEDHPYCAPDAPGKDRMEIPPSDPWRAPLGELSIYELLKEKYLGAARAVMNIDLSDLALPADTSIFDQAVNSSAGIVTLAGRNCYPWRLLKKSATGFGDHICTQFDSENGPRRWCVSPGVVGPDATWRPTKIVVNSARPEHTDFFIRCMALRHPVDAVNKIVPKSSLVENASLLNLSERYFGCKPARMPEVKMAEMDPSDNSTAIVTTMKNEGPFILEWLAYHRVIGVDSFLIYTNDCTDGTDTFLEFLQDKGIVQHRDNKFQGTGLKPQHAALQAAQSEAVVNESNWIICMDVDEFINVKTGNGTLSDLYAAMGDANMISCTWRLFGNADIAAFSDTPVIAAFDLCAPEFIRKPHQAWGFKTLFRNTGIFRKLGVHRPKGLNPQLWDKIRWVNGSGKALPPDMFRNAWRSTKSTYGYDLVSLNHYAVRSAESFLVKRDRGRVNHVDRDQGLSYWFRMNTNSDTDTSIQRMLPLLQQEMDRLLRDPEIAAHHAQCIAAHRAKIEELRATQKYSEFYETLTSERMRRLSRMHQYFGANVFLAGPDCIPDDVAGTDHPEDFFFNVERRKTSH
jgi:glycosyl transferase family 2